MMPSIHEEIQFKIRQLDSAGARKLVEEGLAQAPDADLYYLASLLAKSTDERRDYLEKALSLEPEHLEANSELSKMLNFPYSEGRKGRGIGKGKLLTLAFALLVMLGLGAFYIKENLLYEPVPAHFLGEWEGTSNSDAVGLLSHELHIWAEGGQVVGTSSGSNEDGEAATLIRGHYENGYLIYESYGGNYEGWTGVCYFRVTVEYRIIDGEAHLIGSYETLPPEGDWECSYYGTLDLERAD